MPEPGEMDIERIAAANTLFDLADRFAIEATMWADTDAKRNLGSSARHLFELARQTVRGGSLDIATAYADAGNLLIGNVQGARRFLLSLDHKPIVRRPE